MLYPATIIHGDWSKDPRKRVAALARHLGQGRYVLEAVDQFDHLVPVPTALLSMQAPILAGFDFPIGVPAGYGLKLDLDDFKTFLRALGSARFAAWGEPARRPDEIGFARPFYPARPGNTRREHLLTGHGVGSIADLLRECERQTADRPAACSLFWTLGGNQVGRAAVAGWTEIVRPLVETGTVAIWPFDGALSTCLERFPVTIAETYPADAMRQIGLKLPRPWSKRRQADRREIGAQLLAVAAGLEIELRAEPRNVIADGFGADALGEDRFDAVAGLLGMIAVSKGRRPEGMPEREAITTWEGWIFGQAASDSGLNGRSI